MIYDIPADYIDFIVSRFFSPELEAIKTKLYYFDGSVKTNIITREMLEDIHLSCDYPLDMDSEQTNSEDNSEESREEDPK